MILSRFALLLMLVGSTAAADDNRARVNYMIHCQGCHLPEAVGVPDRVPRMKDFMGYFLNTREGRDFLVRVPGVSTAQLPDDQIVELMNWLLVTYSAGQLPTPFEPFTVDEVIALRQNPVQDPEEERQRILDNIALEVPELAEELAHNNN